MHQGIPKDILESLASPVVASGKTQRASLTRRKTMPKYAEDSRRPNDLICTWKQWQFWKDINCISKTLLKMQWCESEMTCVQCLGDSSSILSSTPQAGHRALLLTVIVLTYLSSKITLLTHSWHLLLLIRRLHCQPPPSSSVLSLSLWVTLEVRCGMCRGNSPSS